MNGFDNDQNKINDGYRRDFGTKRSGEFSYSYTPNNNTQQNENGKPRAWMVAIILAAVFALIFSTVVGALALKTFFGSCVGNGEVTVNSGSGSPTRGANTGKGETQDRPSVPNPNGDTETNNESLSESSCYAVDHGISTIDVTAENLFYHRRYGIDEPVAVVISSEYNEQIVFGDIIVAVNGQNISCAKDIEKALEGCKVGQKVEILLIRDGKQISAEILLYEEVPEHIDF